MGQQWYAFEGAGLPDAIFEFGTYQGNLVFGGLSYIYEWDGVDLKIIGVVDPGGGSAFPTCFIEFEGALLIGGFLRNIDGEFVGGAARYDGEAWSSMSTGMSDNSQVYDFAIFQDTLYAAGFIPELDEEPCHNVVKWDGEKWLPVPGFNSYVSCLLATDSILYAGGSFTLSEAGDSIKRVSYFEDGKWHALGQGLTSHSDIFGVPWNVEELAFFQGKLWASGFFLEYTTSGEAAHMAYLDEDSMWQNPGWTTTGQVWDMVIMQDELFVGGEFWGAFDPYQGAGDPFEVNCALRFDGDSVRSLDGGLTWPAGWFDDTEVYGMGVWNDRLYVGGSFSYAGSVPSDGIAVWADSAPTVGLLSPVYADGGLHPNPVSSGGWLYADLPANSEAQIHFYSLDGRHLSSSRLTTNGVAAPLVGPGIVAYRIDSGDGIYSRGLLQIK